MFSPCVGQLWDSGLFLQNKNSNANKNGNDLDTSSINNNDSKNQHHWSHHFGHARLNIVENINSQFKDRILCPISIQHKFHRPYAIRLNHKESNKESNNEKQNKSKNQDEKVGIKSMGNKIKQEEFSPIQALPLDHHTQNHSFVYLSPSIHSQQIFELKITYQNKIFYLGSEGLTLVPQFVKVWRWNYQDINLTLNNDDEVVNNKNINPHHNHRRSHLSNTDFFIISDPLEKYFLQVVPHYKESIYEIIFDSQIPKKLFDMVFLASPESDFVHIYHKTK